MSEESPLQVILVTDETAPSGRAVAKLLEAAEQGASFEVLIAHLSREGNLKEVTDMGNLYKLEVEPPMPPVESEFNVSVEVREDNLDYVKMNLTLPNRTVITRLMDTNDNVTFKAQFYAADYGLYKAEVIALDLAGSINSIYRYFGTIIPIHVPVTQIEKGSTEKLVDNPHVSINATANETANGTASYVLSN